MKNKFRTLLKKITLNWKSGISVSLVSVPLAVSLAVASNSTPAVGIITAIWAGLIASFFAGSNYNIIGPTGALSGILAAYVIKYGPGALPTMTILTGLFIFAAYFLKLEKYIVFFPSSTIHGFTLGVAGIIMLNQTNAALGLQNLPLHEKFYKNVLESLYHIHKTSYVALSFFLGFLIFLYLLRIIIPKIPNTLIMAPIAIGIGYLATNKFIPVALQTLESKFPDIKPELFAYPHFYFHPLLIIPSAAIALIAIIETMISARIADGLTKTRHNRRKEIFSLGMANIGSGLAGGIPATAALARTALNIKTGCTDRISATISSIFIALIALLFISYFKYLPLPAIAAILVFVAINMIEKKHFIRMYYADKKNFTVALVVAAITIYEDPIIGLLLGATIAMLSFMGKLSEGHFEFASQLPKPEEKKLIKPKDTFVYSIKGHLAYINAQSHIARFDGKQLDYNNIILDLKELYFMDIDGVEALSEIINILHVRQKKVFIVGVNPLIEKMLEESHEFTSLKKNNLVMDSATTVIRTLETPTPVVQQSP